jgi:uncharacterized protein YdaU (DUF1376 family)
MAIDQPWYRHFPDAFLAGTIILTLEERGAYITLVDLIYTRDGNLPDDDRLVARTMGTDPRYWRRLKQRLIAKNKVRIVDGLLMANGCAAELENTHTRIEAARRAGQHSGFIRATKARVRKHLNGGGYEPNGHKPVDTWKQLGGGPSSSPGRGSDGLEASLARLGALVKGGDR